jgi:hypothetical protein
VSGTGQIGTTRPTVKFTLTGVTATGSVGSLGIRSAYTPTGVQGVGEIGNFQVNVNDFVIPIGVEGVGSVGTASIRFGRNITVTGVQGTGAIGTVVPSVKFTASGVLGTGSVGSVTVDIRKLIIPTGVQGVGNIGSSTGYFNRVFATSTSALYADVAERFHADEVLEAGTVVELGGDNEITKSIIELSENVFGVISTRAAYLMNGGAGDDTTHPPVAMTGRVPVRVIGAVRKGDRLVSAGNGLARSAKPGEATAFNVIGRSLDSRDDTGYTEGTVEAIVTVN